jgi:hypothetical protein
MNVVELQYEYKTIIEWLVSFAPNMANRTNFMTESCSWYTYGFNNQEEIIWSVYHPKIFKNGKQTSLIRVSILDDEIATLFRLKFT